MSQYNTRFVYIIIPEDINRNWHGNDHLLQRIVGEKFPDNNVVINVIGKLSSKMQQKEFDEYTIIFVFMDSDYTHLQFAKEHANSSKTLIFTDFYNPEKSIHPVAQNNPRFQQINKREINYTVFEKAMDILVPEKQ
jgi:hypothetical protein